MLRALYGLDFWPSGLPSDASSSVSELFLGAQVYLIADKYLLQPLKNAAAKHFRSLAVDHAASTDFLVAIEELYNALYSQDDLLLDVTAHVVMHHRDALFTEPAFAGFRQKLREIPGFGADIAEAMAVEGGPTRKKRKVGTVQLPKGEVSDYKWYHCPGLHCRRQKTVFGVEQGVAEGYNFSCPLHGCTTNRSQSWWENHRADQR